MRTNLRKGQVVMNTTQPKQYVTRLLKNATSTKGDIRRLRKAERKAFLAGDVNFRLKLNFIAASINAIFFYRPPVNEKMLLPVAVPGAVEDAPIVTASAPEVIPATLSVIDGVATIAPVAAIKKARKPAAKKADKGMAAATAILGKEITAKVKAPRKKATVTA